MEHFQLSGSGLHIQLSVDRRDESKVSELFDCKYDLHVQVRRRLVFVWLLVTFTSKMVFSASILSITISFGALDSAIMLVFALTDSDFATDSIPAVSHAETS